MTKHAPESLEFLIHPKSAYGALRLLALLTQRACAEGRITILINMWGNLSMFNQPSCSLYKRLSSLGERKSNDFSRKALSQTTRGRACDAREGFWRRWPSITYFINAIDYLYICQFALTWRLMTNIMQSSGWLWKRLLKHDLNVILPFPSYSINPNAFRSIQHAVQRTWPWASPMFPACNKRMIDRGRHLHSPESRIDQTNIQALKPCKWLWLRHVGLSPLGAVEVNGLKQAQSQRAPCCVSKSFLKP